LAIASLLFVEARAISSRL